MLISNQTQSSPNGEYRYNQHLYTWQTKTLPNEVAQTKQKISSRADFLVVAELMQRLSLVELANLLIPFWTETADICGGNCSRPTC